MKSPSVIIQNASVKDAKQIIFTGLNITLSADQITAIVSSNFAANHALLNALAELPNYELAKSSQLFTSDKLPLVNRTFYLSSNELINHIEINQLQDATIKKSLILLEQPFINDLELIQVYGQATVKFLQDKTVLMTTSSLKIALMMAHSIYFWPADLGPLIGPIRLDGEPLRAEHDPEVLVMLDRLG